MILGIDLGNFSIKTSTGFSCESRTLEGTGLLTSNTIITRETSTGSKTFVLGEGERCSEYRKVKKENYLDLLFAAICMSSADEKNKIVLGLPVSQFKTDKAELTNLIVNNRSLKGSVGGEEKSIYIEDVEIYPEGIGTVGAEFEGIILDIGGRTTDICQIRKIGSKRKIDNPFSEPIGMINLYSDFIKKLNSKYSLNLTFDDAERILRAGLKLKGLETDISDCKEVFKQYVDKIVNKLKTEYSVDTLDVRIVGGGAIILNKLFIEQLPQAKLIEDSLFANARVFEMVGKQLWKK